MGTHAEQRVLDLRLVEVHADLLQPGQLPLTIQPDHRLKVDRPERGDVRAATG